jgi:hypothetical protein
MNSCRSKAMPSVKLDPSDAFSTQAMLAAGASKPRNLRPFSFLKAATVSGVGDEAVFAGELVDQPGVERFLGRDRIALGGHFQREGDASDARNTLRAASAGEQAELHFGRADFRRGHSDTVMAAERHFAAATERGAVDRGDHRLGRGFDLVDHRRQAGFDEGLAEFGDVGAGEEGAAVTADDHRLDSIVGQTLPDAGFEPLADGGAERVHRWVVRDDDENVVMDFGGDRAGHSTLLDQLSSSPRRLGYPGGARCVRPVVTPACAGVTGMGLGQC